MRVFLALDLPAAMRAAAWSWGRDLAERLGPDADRALTWVPAERMHVTLRFFGELETPHVDRLAQALTRAPFAGAATPAAFGFAGIFPPAGRARVVWLGFSDGQDALRRLHAGIHTRLGELAEPDDELFIPHLTIARVKHGDRVPGRPGAFGRNLRLACMNLPPPDTRGQLNALTLYESRPGPRGPDYEPLARVELA